MKTLILYIALFIVLTSCTISKRMYSNGYTIAWNTPLHKPTSTILIKKNSTLITERFETEALISTINTIPDEYVTTTSASPVAKENKVLIEKREVISDTTVSAKPYKTEMVIKDDRLARISSTSMVSSIVLLLLPLLILGFNLNLDTSTGAGLLVALLLYFLIFMGFGIGIIAGVLGLIALALIINNTKKYSGKTRAIIALIYGILTVIAAYIVILKS